MFKTFATEITKVPYGKTSESHSEYAKWWRNLNRKEYNKKRLEWANSHRERRTKQARRSYLKKQYNLTPEEYDNLVAKQNNCCAICYEVFEFRIDKVGRRIPKLYIDHCHTSGRIRGLLCHSCNTALGHIHDDINLLKRAIEYLKNNKS